MSWWVVWNFWHRVRVSWSRSVPSWMCATNFLFRTHGATTCERQSCNVPAGRLRVPWPRPTFRLNTCWPGVASLCVCVCAWISLKRLKTSGHKSILNKRIFSSSGVKPFITNLTQQRLIIQAYLLLESFMLLVKVLESWNRFCLVFLPFRSSCCCLITHRNHRLMTKHQECLNFQSKCVCCGGCLWGATGPGLRPEATPRPGSNWLYDPKMELTFN